MKMIKYIQDDFPRTKKRPKRKEIWLAYYPYYGKTNMEKLRPVLIHKVKDDEALVQMITSKKSSRTIKEIKLKGSKKPSYLRNSYATIKLYKCYRKIDKI